MAALKHFCIYMNAFYNGGVERVMSTLSKAMTERGIRVDLVVNSAGYSPMWEEIQGSVTIFDLNARRFLDRVPKLARYLKKHRPQCILSAHHITNELAILANILSGTRARVVVSEHTHLSTELCSLPPTSLRRFGIPFLGKLLYRYSDGIVAVSEGVREDVERLFSIQPGKSCTIYNPVDAHRIRALSSEPVDHPWFQAGVNHPIILAIGRLEEQKDFLMLLNAFARIRLRHDAKLVILGEGSQRKALSARVQELGLVDDISLVGFVGNPYAYMRRAAVFALSSAWEGLPVTLIEALVLGIPIVSTDCTSGPNEILQGGEFGTLVPVGDDEAFANALTNALHSEGAKGATASAIDRYDVTAAVDRYIEVMSGIS
jgi:glycosyltransferase involved in cell wall biosynthesis